MKRSVMVAVFSAAVVCAAPACAMDLSLGDAVARIVAESNDVKKADANIKKAQAGLDAANANRWMKVDASVSYMNLLDVERPFSGSYGMTLPPELGGIIAGMLDRPQIAGAVPSRIEFPDNIFMAGVSVTQPIYTFGKIGNAVDGVRSAIKMSDAARDLTVREVTYSATDLYWTAKMTDEMVKISQKSLDDARAARRNLGAAGRANRSNLVKIESDIATKEINLSDAQFNRDTAHRMLKILAGIDVDEELNLTDEFPAAFADIAPKKLTKTPEWDILNEQVRMYESQASSKRAGAYPTLAAMASYNYSSMGADIKDFFNDNDSQSFYWGLALQVPIFGGGVNRANATVDAMNAEAARQDLDRSKKITGEKYQNAIKQYAHLRDNLAKMQEARDLAAKAYGFSQQRFVAGQTSAIELAEVASGLYQLDMALLNAKYKILMSAAMIEKIGE